MSEFEDKVNRALINQEIQHEQENETNTGISQEDTEPAEKFLILTKWERRENQEASLATAIKRMELDLTPENVHVHGKIFHSMLESLGKIHHNFIGEESLSIDMDPENS